MRVVDISYIVIGPLVCEEPYKQIAKLSLFLNRLWTMMRLLAKPPQINSPASKQSKSFIFI